MVSASKFSAVAAAALASALVVTAPAFAKCTRLAASVNDYGKDGPTRDAKDLLDKYIAKFAAERGIKTINTGKKEVTCELFLDFGFFDEYTCKAAATICWPDNQGTAKPTTASGPAPATTAAPAKKSETPKKSPAKAPAAPAPDAVKTKEKA